MSQSSFTAGPTLQSDIKTCKRLALNTRRNHEQEHTDLLEKAAAAFDYTACRDALWSPEEFSLLYGTPLYAQASHAQRLTLNHLYWAAYYAQIISAEIATIYYNQTSAAGLYALEDFRVVCDTLDLETVQERAHIQAFKTISESLEAELFGARIFTYAMRGPFNETMVFADTNRFKSAWKKLQLRSYGLLSAGNAFIACQYFGVRGLRTLNGKMIQHKLAQTFLKHPHRESAPIPAAVSYYHFQDESYHFNSSMVISHDVVRSLPPPTRFERHVANMAIAGCQRDHSNFSAAINGIFWYEPALFESIYQVLRSKVFEMSHAEALSMMRQCFCEENAAIHASHNTHVQATQAYKKYVEAMAYLTPGNREMRRLGNTQVASYLRHNRACLPRFAAALERSGRAA